MNILQIRYYLSLVYVKMQPSVVSSNSVFLGTMGVFVLDERKLCDVKAFGKNGVLVRELPVGVKSFRVPCEWTGRAFRRNLVDITNAYHRLGRKGLNEQYASDEVVTLNRLRSNVVATLADPKNSLLCDALEHRTIFNFNRALGGFSRAELLKIIDFITEWVNAGVGAEFKTPLVDCGYRIKLFSRKNGVMNVYKGSFCNNKFCPSCMKARASRMADQTAYSWRRMVSDRKKPAFYLVTLTCRNVDGQALPEMVRRLSKATTKLFNSWPFCVHEGKRGKQKRKSMYWGYVRSLEITCPRPDEYHPHVHVLMAFRPRFFASKMNEQAKGRWRELWAKALGVDYLPSVNVERVSGENVAREVCKYPVKPADFLNVEESLAENIARVKDLYVALYRVNRIANRGLFREYARDYKKEREKCLRRRRAIQNRELREVRYGSKVLVHDYRRDNKSLKY